VPTKAPAAGERALGNVGACTTVIVSLADPDLAEYQGA
jgi:hypothetical protein